MSFSRRWSKKLKFDWWASLISGPDPPHLLYSLRAYEKKPFNKPASEDKVCYILLTEIYYFVRGCSMILHVVLREKNHQLPGWKLREFPKRVLARSSFLLLLQFRHVSVLPTPRFSLTELGYRSFDGHNLQLDKKSRWACQINLVSADTLTIWWKLSVILEVMELMIFFCVMCRNLKNEDIHRNLSMWFRGANLSRQWSCSRCEGKGKTNMNHVWINWLYCIPIDNMKGCRYIQNEYKCSPPTTFLLNLLFTIRVPW